MGYETKLYIGAFNPDPETWTQREYVTLTEEVQGCPALTTFSLYEKDGEKYFYLTDGDTKVMYEDVRDSVKVTTSDESTYFHVFGMINLSKVGHIPGEHLSKTKALSVLPELYASDGNSLLLYDRYDDRLLIYKGEDVLRALLEYRQHLKDNGYENDPDRGYYWRLKAAIDFLQTCLNSGWNQIGVIFYGY